MELWLVPVKVGNFATKTGASLVSSTGRALLLDFLRWARKYDKQMRDNEEYFGGTPYGQAIQWFKDLHLLKFGVDAGEVERRIYGKSDKVKVKPTFR
jgi:hypothetical protein